MTEPRLSIGLPVHNGERYLRQALESILGQTFSDFELLIGDNASTDATEVICKEFVERDDRVRYFRHAENLGAAPNWNSLFEMARAKYFKWMACDDLYDPRFLERCVEALDADPDVVLAFSRVNRIDEHGRVVGRYDKYDNSLRITSKSPSTRFGDAICIQHGCYANFGVMRSSVLRQTPLHGSYEGSDRNLLAEMALRGRWHQDAEYLFDRRDHPNAYASVRRPDRIGWFDSTRREDITFPHWRNLREYMRSVRSVPLSSGDRIRCWLQFARWLIGPRWYRQHWLQLLGDLGRGATAVVSRRLQATTDDC